MKNVVKLAVVGLAGYFIGFYEMKYKVMKAIVKRNIDNLEKSDEDSKEES